MPTRISYDGMSRLTAAGYLENGKRNDHFSTSYKYDLMGNILSLRREGLLNSGSYGTIDDLTYSYKGNQVVKIDDAAEESPSYKGAMHFRDYADEETEYTYDANGNMLTDSNKGITSIDYNVLDLPQCISTKSRVLFKENSNDTIYYTYSADGTKLRSTYKKAEFRVYPYNPETSLTSLNVETGLNVGTVGMAKPIAKRLKTKYYYCSNLVYDNENISAILFDGGYASVDDDNGIVMHFYVKDHLGSNRLVVDGNGNIEEVNHYYPFGALMGDRCGVSQNNYKYIGKELDTMYGWNMQDHEARWYDPVVGRWMVTDPLQEKYFDSSLSSLWYGVDPLAGKYANNSPYVYCNDNPIRLIDSNGKAPGDFFLSIEKVAVDFGLFYNDNSIREDIEYGSSIYQVRNSNGQLGYTYTIAERGSKHGVTPSCPNLFRKVVADIHTHGAWSNGEYKDNEFSGIRDKKGNLLTSDKLQKVDTQNGDIGDSNRTQLTSFLVTPNGSLQSYDPKTGKIKVLSNNMPSDYRDPDRMNSVSSYIEKHPLSIMKEASQKLKESINIIDK